MTPFFCRVEGGSRVVFLKLWGEMDLLLFLKGLAIGFLLAVPIGPAGILCIRKSLTEGHTRALFTGLGAATIDALYAGIAAFGVTLVSDLIAVHQTPLRLAGGGLLLFLGTRMFQISRTGLAVSSDGKGALGSYLTTVLLGITNPVTLFAFLAVFATFGLGNGLLVVSTFIPVLGVFAGSCLWFFTLTFTATFFRKKLDAGGFIWVNRISGALIILSAILAFVSVI
jgi:threonine/homoserine/homoserine lactone efflux protein